MSPSTVEQVRALLGELKRDHWTRRGTVPATLQEAIRLLDALTPEAKPMPHDDLTHGAQSCCDIRLMLEQSLNRRAAVEDEMGKCIRGLLPMPDAAKLKNWAQRLGVPEGWDK